MYKNITRQSIACLIASSLYAVLGIILLSGGTIVSITIALLLFAGAIGAYYKKTELLDLCLIILVIISLSSLILIDPLDPDMHDEDLDKFMQSANIRLIITVLLYTLCLVYFYCLNAIRKFPIKQVISTLVFFFLVTIMVIYLRS